MKIMSIMFGLFGTGCVVYAAFREWGVTGAMTLLGSLLLLGAFALALYTITDGDSAKRTRGPFPRPPA